MSDIPTISEQYENQQQFLRELGQQDRAFAEGRDQGRREGREEVYALVRQLPSPVMPIVSGQAYRRTGWRCDWCRGAWAEGRHAEYHEETCLWAAAHASTGSQEPTT